MWDLHSLIRNRTGIPCIGRRSLNHWTAREAPYWWISKREPSLCSFWLERARERAFLPCWTLTELSRRAPVLDSPGRTPLLRKPNPGHLRSGFYLSLWPAYISKWSFCQFLGHYQLLRACKRSLTMEETLKALIMVHIHCFPSSAGFENGTS